MDNKLVFSVFVSAVLGGFFSNSMPAQQPFAQPRVRITQSIDNTQLQTLRGNTHPLAKPQFDQGAAPTDLPMQQMLMVLSRTPEQQAALDTLLAQQLDKSSANYHKWLTPEQFGAQFGASDQDIQTISAWLESQGFTVNAVSKGKTVIQFSGTAMAVENGFHTNIHKYVVNGAEHWANAGDPQIPAALTPVVTGVVSMHNFQKKSQIVGTREIPFTYTPGSRPQYTVSVGNTYALAPADYATIYDVNPIYQAGINGSGTTIAVVARSNILVSDVTTFRSMLGLSNNPPNVVITNSDPGRVSGDEAEADLDTTWAGAIAPSATVDLIVSSSTNSTDGVDLSELYIIDNNSGDIMTESYGDCEANYTASQAQYYASLAQQAAAEGITYTVAAGDSGAEGCDDPNSELTASGPISVNVLAANAYVTAVGGTEFNENGNYAQYWSASNNSEGGSALSYIPEDVWNESCTVAQCGNQNAGIWAGGGGASTLYAKPSWQTGVYGIPSDGVRDVPDVALTAASHDFYLLCLDNSCSATRRRGSSFSGVSGTSAPTPSFAGIMALVVQKTGSRLGQANAVLYAMAAQENLSLCNASVTSGLPAAGCVFNDVTVGNDAVPGETGYGTSTADYQAGTGYDLATGLGSVNVANLVNEWNGAVSSTSSSGPFYISIDPPGTLNSTFIGASTFLGYALNVNAAITGVAIAIDGIPYGSATYGLSRTDACAAYAGVGCPNVGWSFSIDTTQLSSATHTLEATATATDGTHATAASSFTVANWSTSDPMIVDIDAPNRSGAVYSGVVGFGGWALDKTGAISNVLVAIDGVPYSTATYGASRPDVCAVYPGRAGCPNVGWNFGLDTTTLADGTHTIAVTGFTANGENTTVTRTFTVSNASGNPIQVSIDRPGPGTPAFSGPVDFGGWAIDNSSGVGISSIAVSIDGTSYGDGVYGASRPDVCTVYPGRTGCPNVGWNFVLDTTALGNGNHSVEVTATATTGQRKTVSSTFAVANTTAGGPLKMSIDTPGAQNSTVTGLTGVEGWAIDDNGAINTVNIYVDGALRGSATYGYSRQDVCNAYPGRAGCPNVGWAYTLDTTLIADGVHTVAATGTAANGDQLTITTSITVANWTSGNPMRISIDNPNAKSAAFSGVVGFGGWAIDDAAGISTVALSIDGAFVGNATYGANRPDVCAVYPGRAGCPNVGWNFGIDTRQYANGTHTLAVTVTSSGGQHTTVTSTFQVSNTSKVALSIDRPSAQSGTFSGSVDFGGWALDTTGGGAITAVQILIDGALFGNATYGADRPDVCAVAAYSSAVGCPNVGWNVLVDTTLLANGTHVLQARAISSSGQVDTRSSSFLVYNAQ